MVNLDWIRYQTKPKKMYLPYERYSASQPPWSRLPAEPELHVDEFYEKRNPIALKLASDLAGLCKKVYWQQTLPMKICTVADVGNERGQQRGNGAQRASINHS